MADNVSIYFGDAAEEEVLMRFDAVTDESKPRSARIREAMLLQVVVEEALDASGLDLDEDSKRRYLRSLITSDN